jgi:hypothetical protein
LENLELKLSAFVGIMFGVAVFTVILFIYPEDALLMGLLSYVLFTIMMWIFLKIHNKRINSKYAQLEKEFLSPYFYKTNGNFNFGNKVVNCNIYLFDDGFLFASLDEKPYRLEQLPIQRILKYEADNFHLNIYTTDDQVFVITTKDAAELIDKIREKGWIQ